VPLAQSLGNVFAADLNGDAKPDLFASRASVSSTRC
jgi:hypothetical protein